MKISYIILPYDDEKYLKRCLYYLNNQKNCNFEIVVSESVISEEGQIAIGKIGVIDEIVSSPFQEGLSYSEKVKNALIKASGDYIVFVSVNDVVKNDLGECISKAEKTEILMHGVYHKVGKNYLPLIQKENLKDRYIADKRLFCYSKEIIKEFEYYFIQENADVSSVVDIILLRGKKFFCLDNLYVYGENLKDKTIQVFYKDLVKKVIQSIFEGELSEIKMIMFDKYLRQLLSFLREEDRTDMEKNEIYGILKLMGEHSSKNIIYEELFMSEVNCNYDKLSKLDYTGYLYCTKNGLLKSDD